ncbi:MAG: lytic transglycosylase domain-containing protein [Bacteroidales bacterium]|nr:lytic transglycosylase domain-containing protein [Bacteroidales bacterium]
MKRKGIGCRGCSGGIGLFDNLIDRLKAESRQPRPSAFDRAKQTAANITQFQKEQRIDPVVQALQQYAQNYNTAQTDEGRQAANTMANQIRGNYLSGGGSGMDLPQQYWGSAPDAGFQTAEGFQAPVTGYEGMGRKDTIALKRQTLLDAMTKRLQEAGLTGIDPSTGQKTWDRQYQEASLAAAARGSGGSSINTKTARAEAISDMAAKLNEIKVNPDKYGDMAPIQALEKWINTPDVLSAFASIGLNTSALLDDAYRLEYGKTRSEYWRDANKAIGNKQDPIDGLFNSLLSDSVNPNIASAAEREGIPAALLSALVDAESSGNPNAMSPAGAIGLTQLMPGTAEGLGVDPYDPEQNLAGGARYLKQMYDKYGDWGLALAAYNAGPGAIDQYGGIPPYQETRNYVAKVLGNAGMG